MKFAITGGTGFVGTALTEELLENGHEVTILTRRPDKRSRRPKLSFVQWLHPGTAPEKALKQTDVFINLAGASINNRWTPEMKRKIIKSRVEATSEVLRIIETMAKKPQVLINASAVGYYGTSLSKTFTEDDQDPGDDFLAATVSEWEKTADRAKTLGVRTVLCRFGIILDKDEGALPRIALPYKLFAGGTVGSGDQWVSWIHLADVIKGLLFVLENEGIEGPVNFTSPEPVRMKQFGKTLGRALHRPHWLPVPEFVLKFGLGEMSMLVLKGQKAIPEKLLGNGFSFRYPHLESSLQSIYRR